MALPYSGPMPQNPFGDQPPVPDFMQTDAPMQIVPHSPIQSLLEAPKMKKRGMFGGVSIDPAAGLAGFLAGLGNPAGQMALQAIHQRRMMEQQQALAAQQYAQDRQDKRDDFLFEQDYRAQHPGVPDISQRIAVLNQIRPGLGDTYAQNYAQNGGGLGSIFKDPSTGQSYTINPQAGPQPGAVEDGYRFKGGNPADPNAWEPVGGAGGNASGGFPY
jgi:hypothetical protein